MEKFSYKYNLECCQQFAMSEVLSPAHYAIFPRTPMLLHSITQNRDLFGLNLVYYYGGGTMCVIIQQMVMPDLQHPHRICNATSITD